eukprot:TRINITY_DN4935_c0_g1_i1.p1 TRINITY_DN4935_c0_g1~~TRINITY_DN4935_c0_g1_i1.p1  ORF type:complete len:650 (-),score=243.99 TRINITY_DN4935_c0_g1_i1:1924-3873(-)
MGGKKKSTEKVHSMSDKGRKKAEPGMRSAQTVRRLQMYRSKVKRNDKGDIVKGSVLSKNEREPGKMARIAPNRKWFGNTRVITPHELDFYRKQMLEKDNDPHLVLLEKKKLPRGLLEEPDRTGGRMKILEVEPFHETFGKGKRRKRPKLSSDLLDIPSLAGAVQERESCYIEDKDRNVALGKNDLPEFRKEVREDALMKGTSRRIWGELYKVLDSSDVIVQVLDARDPMGTRCKHVEEVVRKEKSHKHIVLLLNKCDLIPTWATARWVKVLSKEFPTLAFHASLDHPFGKGSLIQLLRQYSIFHSDKKNISVGFIGYPNVGKSSVINSLRKKKVCNVAPIPGETKVWQYITLMKRIFLIDCPGIVPPNADSDTDIVLKGVVRVENIQDVEMHIPAVIERVKKEYIEKTYGVKEWTDSMDFLEQVCRTTGKLVRGGEPDFVNAARRILHDWQRGRLPWFLPPPMPEGDGSDEEGHAEKDDGKEAGEKDEKDVIEKEKESGLARIHVDEEDYSKIRVAHRVYADEDGSDEEGHAEKDDGKEAGEKDEKDVIEKEKESGLARIHVDEEDYSKIRVAHRVYADEDVDGDYDDYDDVDGVEDIEVGSEERNEPGGEGEEEEEDVAWEDVFDDEEEEEYEDEDGDTGKRGRKAKK